MEKQIKNIYVGKELEIFAAAKNWSLYIASVLRPYLSGVVIEVGSGIGSRAKNLHIFSTKWIAVEPDLNLSLPLHSEVQKNPIFSNIEIFNGFIGDLPMDQSANSILYVDVLEHIKDDRQELRLAAARLDIGGYLIVLSPAHNFLYSNFDRAIGHHRRYSSASLIDLSPPGCVLVEKKMLDSVGLLASLGNAIFLKRSLPSSGQIYFWDSFMIPLSRLIDRLIFFSLGKSILMIWKKVV